MKQAEAGIGLEPAIFVYAVLLAAWWVLVLGTDAQAYIDPSAGGMLVQLVLAGTAGVAVLGKLFWGRIKRLFGASEVAPPAEAVTRQTDDPHDPV